MSQGWIKLHRKLMDNALMAKSAYFHLWVTLLLMAAHKEHEFIFNNRIHILKPGQLITGRKKLSKLTGIPHTTVERILKCLESGHKINQKITKKYRIISIVKWEDYQSQSNSESDTGPVMSQTRADGGPITDTYKNEKNEKNENKHMRGKFYYASEELEMQRIREANERARAKFLAEGD
jgi:DNA replication protein DnaD